MNKVIHCAVRRDLSRFKTVLEKFSDGDKARAAALYRAWQNFDAQLTDDHEGEHEIAWAGLKVVGVDQATIDGFDHEHELMSADLATTRRRWRSWRHRRAGPRRRGRGGDGEARDDDRPRPRPRGGDERAAVPEGGRQPGDQGDGNKFSRWTGIGKAGEFMAWLEDGATAEEKAGRRGNVPGPVVTIIGGLFGAVTASEVAPVWASSFSF